MKSNKLQSIREQRLQAEAKLKELQQAEVDAAIGDIVIDDPEFNSITRGISKRRKSVQRLKQVKGRKEYSLRVQEQKIQELKSDIGDLVNDLAGKQEELTALESRATEIKQNYYKASTDSKVRA